jgi:ABC-type nitrate/sulfonate/bicarbonate transport system substrate-binding protein
MAKLLRIFHRSANRTDSSRRGRPRLGIHRYVVATLATIFFLPFLSGKSYSQTDPIRVYFYPPWNISKLPMYMARDAGVFERDGLNVVWTNPGSNEKLLAALKNAADLRGKKIGSGEPGSTPDQLTRLALRKLGIDPDKDVTLVHFDDGRNSGRVKNLLSGDIAAMMITAEAMYDLEKSGEIKRLNRLADHKELKIYAGGGADYAMSATFLKNRREDAKKFMSGICAGIALARNDKPKALSFVAKTGRNLAAAAIDYLYRLYIADVIPARPYLKPEGIELAIQMTAALFPNVAPMKAADLVDAALVPELEKSGQCNN